MVVFFKFHFLLYQTFENLLTVTICDFIITEKWVKKQMSLDSAMQNQHIIVNEQLNIHWFISLQENDILEKSLIYDVIIL